MAVGVQIADIYNPLIWDKSIQEAAIESSAFLQCGVMVNNPIVAGLASGSSTIGELPFFKGLTNNEPNYSSDDSAVLSSPDKVTGAKQVFRKAFQNKSWSTMDLANEVAAIDPIEAITGRIGKYWGVSTTKRLINSLTGIMLSNIANNSADMVADVATLETGAAPSAAKCINNALIVQAQATLGDHAPALTTICMHSVPFATLQNLNLITYLPLSEQSIKFPHYLGYRVIVDDSLPVRAGSTSGFVYTSILCGSDAVGYGMGNPEHPTELFRVPSAGNGGGQDLIFSRQTEIIHPFGFSFGSASVAGQSATYAELALAANWTRVYASRKNVPLAFMRTNG
jgi:hypothetical protein